MKYEIRNKGDMLSGSSLTVSIPESELDRKALYTIIEEKPGFLLPFSYKTIGGCAELEYKVDRRCKLRHVAGERGRKDYSELWNRLLTPLLECGDWFLKPYSFVLDVGHIYCDKSDNTVCFVYIPAVGDCSDYSALKEMAAEFSKLITIADTEVENKVLRAIMSGFNPKVFLELLQPCPAVAKPQEKEPDVLRAAPPYAEYNRRALPPAEYSQLKAERSAPQAGDPIVSGTPQGMPGDIIIDIPEDLKAARKTRKSMEKTREKQRDKPRGKQRKRLKPYNNSDIVLEGTTAAHGEAPMDKPRFPEAEAIRSAAYGQDAFPDEYARDIGVREITQSLSYTAGGARLRLVGKPTLPPGIDIAVSEGGIFTIGRIDTSRGLRRSDFEFDRTTKAVSRRHAAIERYAEGYSLIDLASSAGTYMDGQRLPPNTPIELRQGCRVSFGNCGAEYIWEA